MATTYTLTGSLLDAGVPFTTNAQAWVALANANALIDGSTDAMILGRWPLTLGGSGEFTLSLPSTASGAGYMPDGGFAYQLYVWYRDSAPKATRITQVSEPFTLTANSTLADVLGDTIELRSVSAAEWADFQAKYDAMPGYVAAAEAAAELAVAPTADVVNEVLTDPASDASLTLSATIEAGVAEVIDPSGAVADDIAVWDSVAGKFKPGPKPMGGGDDTSFAFNLMHKLDNDTGNAVLAVSGDSVSIDSGGWVWRLTNKLATRYPKFTVVYKAKTAGANTYDADVVIQTGVGGNGNTLTIYNWSQTGANVGVGYASDALFSTAYPVAPDLFLISTGHNDWNTPAEEVTRYLRMGAQRLARRYPATSVAVVTMNPKNPAESHYLNKFRTEQQKIAAAGALGFGVLDLETAWLDRPGGYASLMGDDTHPNGTGSELLAVTALNAFTSAKPGGVVGQPRRVQQDLIVPLLGGVAAGGAPAPAVQGSYAQTWGVKFSNTTDDDWVCPPILVPEFWERMAVEVIWCSQGNAVAATGIYLTVDYASLSAGNNAPGLNVYAGATVITGALAGQTQVTTIKNESVPHVPAALARQGTALTTPFAPWQFRIKRTSSHASDTHDGSILIYALRLIRVY